MIETIPPPIPAATIILFCDDDNGPARHLMIKRGDKMSFAANALVFPGGRVDKDDEAIANNLKLCPGAPGNIEDARGRVTAIRETIEETGVAIALDPKPDAAMIMEWRLALGRGVLLSALLERSGIRLNLSAVVPFARWCPNFSDYRRFDTRFYISHIAGMPSVVVDGDEATHFIWLTAQKALDHSDKGRHKIIFPTRCNLERLATLENFDSAVRHAAKTPLITITPWLEERNGKQILCIPAEAGYPVHAIPFDKVIKP